MVKKSAAHGNKILPALPFTTQDKDIFERIISEVEDYAIILLDATGIVTTWNKGAEKIKGYATRDIIGKSFRLFYREEDREKNLPEKLLAEAANNRSVTNEGYRIKKDGSTFWASVVITALHDDRGGLIGFSKVTKDLTDRKMAEDKLQRSAQELAVQNELLKASEERYHKMIAEVQDYAILLLSKDGEIQNWNAGAEAIKGYSAAEIIGRNFRIFYLPEDVQAGLPDRLLEEAARKGRASNEGWRRRKDGSRFWGSIVITALHGNDGEIIGFSKVTRDLTEKKLVDDQLKDKKTELEFKNHELERLNGELSSFAYVVSHDLKEPIRKIQIFGNRQLEAGKSLEEIIEFSKKIINSAVRMQHLMEALLSYSLVTNDQSKFEKVALNDVLASVMTDLEVTISETKARIQVSDLPVTRGISYQLQQLFLNLISNAIKFAKSDVAPLIQILSQTVSSADLPQELASKSGTYFRVSVSDNGTGFDQHYANRIFEVFQRLQVGPEIRGTGIGLAIVKKVAVNHNGFVIAESERNRGATFHVYLPAFEK